jgi:hypothetical protein
LYPAHIPLHGSGEGKGTSSDKACLVADCLLLFWFV